MRLQSSHLKEVYAPFGVHFRIPSLWLYAVNTAVPYPFVLRNLTVQLQVQHFHNRTLPEPIWPYTIYSIAYSPILQL